MINKIIIEGPDCSGKSTAVNTIKNALRWDSKSLHHQSGDQFTRYIKEYTFNSNIVFDRSHFSEIVYSKLWRGGSPFSNKELEFLNFLAQRDTITIFVIPEIKVLKERYLNRDYEQQIKLSELKESQKLFKQVSKNINHILYLSSSYEELDQLVNKIKKIVK